MFRYYLEWTCMLVLCGHILPSISTDDCKGKCKNANGRYSFGNKVGAPKLKWKFTTKNVPLKRQLEIHCPLCQSNPPSTLTWLFTGRPLNFTQRKENIQREYTLCSEKLSVRIRSKQDAGNYTCVVRNSLGFANATTEVVDAFGSDSPPVDMTLQGHVMGYDARIGWPLNITCTQAYPRCHITWFKDGKEFNGTPDRRMELVEDQARTGSQIRECGSKLRIKNATANDAGRYNCISNKFKSENSININVVLCFQGYYCPLKATTAQRCPEGTFSMEKNATIVGHCKPCPTHETNKIANGLTGETAVKFRENCRRPATKDLLKTSSLSTGEKIAVGVSVVVIVVLIVVAVSCGLRNRWKRKYAPTPVNKNLIEIPDIPRSNDVFICYSSQNKKWVLETLRRNLDAQDFQTCIDVLDFEGGVAIHNNITNAIYGSRKTIFVLSPDSLKSYYARTELRQALVAGKAGHTEVIVILYEKCEVPVEIRANKIYLDWTDKQNREIFWDKLYRAIRRPLSDERM